MKKPKTQTQQQQRELMEADMNQANMKEEDNHEANIKEKDMNVEDITPPEGFFKIINDFTADIVTTFPEYSGIIGKWWSRDETKQEAETLVVFRHCLKTFPERFFDILYKTTGIFEDTECNTEFLPGIVFKQLWISDISANTKETIWKYLQLILFSIIGTIHNSTELGETAKLFENVDEGELKDKLHETLGNMQHLFGSNENTNENTNENNNSGINMENIPDAEEIHDHINGLLGGKLGKLAMELAEETASSLNIDPNTTGDAGEVFQELFKNPGKLMGMVKNVGDKIDTKIKSGEIKESELISEGMELLTKMKDMPGMGNIQEMCEKMGVPMPPGFGKNTKVNTGAMQSQMTSNLKLAKMKERMKKKAELNAVNNEIQKNLAQNQPTVTEDEILNIFSTGENVERTPRGTKPPIKKKKKKK